MFSVVIPLYNKASHIYDCIQSVRSQSYPASEIIVVDDGSTDVGAHIIQSSFPRQVRLVSQQNQGVSCARNKGIELASNELVCLLDADDEWCEDYLMQMSRLVTTFNDCVFYGSGYTFYDQCFGISKPPNPFRTPFFGACDFYSSFLAGSGIVSSSSVCIRKTVVLSIGGFPPNCMCGEDIHLWLRLASLGSYGFNSQSLVKVRRDMKAATFLGRLNEVPCFIPLLVGMLRTQTVKHKTRYLDLTLRKYSLLYMLFAVQNGNRLLAKRILKSIRKEFTMLALVLTIISFIPQFIADCIICLAFRSRKS
jgi:glycosyltransferase involved in cell wall biosynthesis